MQQHVDVAALDAQRRGHVLAVALLEHAEGHDGALGVAETVDARAEADVFLGRRDLRVGRARGRGRLLVDRLVRARAVVPAPHVAREVPDDAPEEGTARLVGRQLSAQGELKKRAERIMHAVHGVFVVEAFAPGDRGQDRALGADGARKELEHVGPGGGRGLLRGFGLHLHGVCRSARILHVRSRVLATATGMSHVIVVTDATFEREVLAEEGSVLVDFGATWCPPCRVLRPILEAVARERAGTLKVVEIDMDASPESVRRCAVRAAPTLVVFRHGEKRAVHVGAVPKEKLFALVDRS